MTIGWTRGSGDNVLVVVRAGSPVNAYPLDGTFYNANIAFGSGTQIGTGNYVVYNGSGTSVTLTGLVSDSTYYFAIYEYTSGTNCYKTPALTGNATTIVCTETTPVIGTITQPTCEIATGSVNLSGLPSTGTWILTRTPGNITTTGAGTSTTITGLAAGNYTYTVTNASGCTSPSSGNVFIDAQPALPAVPTVGTITQPTCDIATGSVVLSNLPTTGTWTLTRSPGNITTTGTGTSTTITGLAAGNYTYTVTNASGCTSPSSGNVFIDAQPALPAVPTVGTITQPTCDIATGSVVLSNLPTTGTWTLTRTPGNITTTGTGTSTTITGLAAGTYTYTIINASGCTSVSSASVVINDQPATPEAPIITLNGNILHSNAINGNQWYNQLGIINGATNQDYIVTLNGDYNVIVTIDGCSSVASNIINVVLSGIELADNINTIQIYPNPSTGIISIIFPENNTVSRFEVINPSGKIILRKNVSKKIEQVELKDSGIYTLRFYSKNNVYSKSIIIGN
jgi:hypothetical protein